VVKYDDFPKPGHIYVYTIHAAIYAVGSMSMHIAIRLYIILDVHKFIADNIFHQLFKYGEDLE